MAQAHPFLYSAPRHDDKRMLNLVSTRDPEANAQLRIALHELGYDYDESILNFSANQCSFDLLPEELSRRVELPFVRKGDVFVLTTRFPLTDGLPHESKKDRTQQYHHRTRDVHAFLALFQDLLAILSGTHGRGRKLSARRKVEAAIEALGG